MFKHNKLKPIASYANVVIEGNKIVRLNCGMIAVVMGIILRMGEHERNGPGSVRHV